MALAVPAATEPVDMTGLSCVQFTSIGKRAWEFYGDRAIRYYDDGSVSSLPRIGEGVYERHSREGEWSAVYYFFDRGDGVQLRVLSRAGLLEREENRATPLKKSVFSFNGECVLISEQQ